MKPIWPKTYSSWIENDTLYISIPFTWELPEIEATLIKRSFHYSSIVVGGPAIYLMPDYFSAYELVSVKREYPGILQKINPLATRTTTGCPNKCKFCGVNIIEPGGFTELDDWPDLPILCDNNLLASSPSHFDKVMDRLVKWEGVDFNQGLDASLLTPYHARRIAELKHPMVRLSLDSYGERDIWSKAFECLLDNGVKKKQIRTYILIGFNDSPEMAWEQCNWIREKGVVPNPQWFHELSALAKNQVTPKQKENGWTDRERVKIMRWFYKRIRSKTKHEILLGE